MDHLAAERAHLLERCREVRHGEIGKREAVSWAWGALVYPDGSAGVHALPTLTLVRAPRCERRFQQLLPEASRPFRLICRKLDQERWRRHPSDGTDKAAALLEESTR